MVGLDEEAVILLRLRDLQIVRQWQIDAALAYLWAPRKLLIWELSPNICHQGMETAADHGHCAIELHAMSQWLSDLQLLCYSAPSMKDFAPYSPVKFQPSNCQFLFAFFNILNQCAEILLQQLLGVNFISNSFLTFVILLNQYRGSES